MRANPLPANGPGAQGVFLSGTSPKTVPEMDAAAAVKLLIREKLAHIKRERPLLIVIDGDSCVGKTCLSQNIFSGWRAFIIHRDLVYDYVIRALKAQGLSNDEDYFAEALIKRFVQIIEGALDYGGYELIVLEGFNMLEITAEIERLYSYSCEISINIRADIMTRLWILERKRVACPDQLADGINREQGPSEEDDTRLTDAGFLRRNTQSYRFPTHYDLIIDNSLGSRHRQEGEAWHNHGMSARETGSDFFFLGKGSEPYTSKAGEDTVSLPGFSFSNLNEYRLRLRGFNDKQPLIFRRGKAPVGYGPLFTGTFFVYAKRGRSYAKANKIRIDGNGEPAFCLPCEGRKYDIIEVLLNQFEPIALPVKNHDFSLSKTGIVHCKNWLEWLKERHRKIPRKLIAQAGLFRPRHYHLALSCGFDSNFVWLWDSPEEMIKPHSRPRQRFSLSYYSIPNNELAAEYDLLQILRSQHRERIRQYKVNWPSRPKRGWARLSKLRLSGLRRYLKYLQEDAGVRGLGGLEIRLDEFILYGFGSVAGLELIERRNGKNNEREIRYVAMFDKNGQLLDGDYRLVEAGKERRRPWRLEILSAMEDEGSAIFLHIRKNGLIRVKDFTYILRDLNIVDGSGNAFGVGQVCVTKRRLPDGKFLLEVKPIVGRERRGFVLGYTVSFILVDAQGRPWGIELRDSQNSMLFAEAVSRQQRISPQLLLPEGFIPAAPPANHGMRAQEVFSNEGLSGNFQNIPAQVNGEFIAEEEIYPQQALYWAFRGKIVADSFDFSAGNSEAGKFLDFNYGAHYSAASGSDFGSYFRAGRVNADACGSFRRDNYFRASGIQRHFQVNRLASSGDPRMTDNQAVLRGDLKFGHGLKGGDKTLWHFVVRIFNQKRGCSFDGEELPVDFMPSGAVPEEPAGNRGGGSFLYFIHGNQKPLSGELLFDFLNLLGNHIIHLIKKITQNGDESKAFLMLRAGGVAPSCTPANHGMSAQEDEACFRSKKMVLITAEGDEAGFPVKGNDKAVKEIFLPDEVKICAQVRGEADRCGKGEDADFDAKLMDIDGDKPAVADHDMGEPSFFNVNTQVGGERTQKYRDGGAAVNIGFGFKRSGWPVNQDFDDWEELAFEIGVRKPGGFAHRRWLNSSGAGTGNDRGVALGNFFLACLTASLPEKISPWQITMRWCGYNLTNSVRFAFTKASLSMRVTIILLLCLEQKKYTLLNSRSQGVNTPANHGMAAQEVGIGRGLNPGQAGDCAAARPHSQEQLREMERKFEELIPHLFFSAYRWAMRIRKALSEVKESLGSDFDTRPKERLRRVEKLRTIIMSEEGYNPALHKICALYPGCVCPEKADEGTVRWIIGILPHGVGRPRVDMWRAIDDVKRLLKGKRGVIPDEQKRKIIFFLLGRGEFEEFEQSVTALGFIIANNLSCNPDYYGGNNFTSSFTCRQAAKAGYTLETVAAAVRKKIKSKKDNPHRRLRMRAGTGRGLNPGQAGDCAAARPYGKGKE